MPPGTPASPIVAQSFPTTAKRRRAKFWLWPNLLSLDAPLIASLWQHLVAAELAISLSWASRLALPLAVWIIYLSDRLLDTFRAAGAPQTKRHRFYCAHRFGGAALLATAVVALLITLKFLPLPVLKNGLLLSCLVGAYLLVVHLLPATVGNWLPKELAVALIFSLGTFVAPWTWLTQSWPLVVTALLFAALCWINCAAIEVWEWRRVGTTNDRPHLASAWLVEHIRVAGLCLGICALLFSTITICPLALLCIAAGGFAFVWLTNIQSSLGADTLRVLADVPLLTPILLLGRHWE